MQQVFITGANRGIGLAFTKEYLKRGAKVFAACRDPERAAALHDLVEQCGAQIVVVPLEVTDAAQIDQCYEAVQAHTSSLDVLINNAGILRQADDFTEITAEALMDSFAVNAVAPLRIIQRFVDLVAAGTNPRIVNITGPTPPITKLSHRGNHIYLASRYASNALTKMVALDLADRGIITIALWPGFIRTDMNNNNPEAALPEEGIKPAVNVIEGLTMEHNGCCLLNDGRVYEW